MHGSLGDEVAFTGFVREYVRARGGPVGVDVKRMELFEGNPRVCPARGNVLTATWEPENIAGNFVRGWCWKTGTPCIDDSPELFFTEEGPKSRDVLVDTWAGWPSRRWPLRFWRQLADQIEQKGRECVEVGAWVPDCTGAQRVPSQLPRSLVGQTTLKQVAQLIRNSSLLIASDSGLAHVAAAVGTPAIVLYGPRWWYSRAYRSTYPIQADCCFQCNEHCAASTSCMERIEPKHVLDTMEEFNL